ncbi:putative transcription factor bHLH041 [Senna tora]|uniref:Putative transcription factor bHLH041 n=1 Tax=Senna tora TaxID=362788 RepID=A0A834X5G2_9FABA|nr:putative transcription factor bHLH041 [Senna tora]
MYSLESEDEVLTKAFLQVLSSNSVEEGGSAFKRELNLLRMGSSSHSQRFEGSSSHIHMLHNISERRRRQKLNQNFQALRALLPPGTKVPTERLKWLMAESDKCRNRKQQLIERLMSSSSSVGVSVSRVDQTMVELRLKSTTNSQINVCIGVLEFLKGGHAHHNVNFVSMAATIHEVIFRLKIIEESEWDQAAFQEALRTDLLNILSSK